MDKICLLILLCTGIGCTQFVKMKTEAEIAKEKGDSLMREFKK
jgi:hypothetical protein